MIVSGSSATRTTVLYKSGTTSSLIVSYTSSPQKLEDQPEEEASEEHLLDHWSGRTGQEDPLRGRDPSQGLVEDPGKPPDAPGSGKTGDKAVKPESLTR